MLLGSKHATACPDSFFLLDLRLSSSPPGLHGGLVWESRNPGMPGAPRGAGGQERPGEEAAAQGIRRRQTSVAVRWGWLRSCGLGRGASTSPVLHFCSEASLNISEPAFLSAKHFPFPHFFSSNVGYFMLASLCLPSASLAPIQSLVASAALKSWQGHPKREEHRQQP